MALLFVVEEEPGLLLDQRAADRSAELLQDVDGLGDAIGFADCVVGAGSGIAVVVKSVAMESVGPRLGDGIEESGGAAAISRRIRRDRDLKLLNGIFTKHVRDAFAAAGISEVVTCGAGSIESEGVRAIAVGVTSVFSALFAGKTDQAGLAVGRGVGSEEGEIGVTAAAEWQVIEVVTIDDSTERRVGGAEGGSLRGYEHHLR